MLLLPITALLAGVAAAFVSDQEYLGFEPEAQEHLGFEHKHQQRPNIVFILTDDQDVHLSSLDYMPYVKKHLIEEGTYFDRHYCTTAVCCPSRVTLMTGKASHNTNITDVNPPYGGYPKFVKQGFNEAYLPVWLQEGGYDVYYTGKLFNVHTVDNYNDPYPAGFKSTVTIPKKTYSRYILIRRTGLSLGSVHIQLPQQHLRFE